MKPTPSVASELLGGLTPTPVFYAYWQFAYERQEIFYRRMRNCEDQVTDDPILARYKFTNAYRAADRVSQYLIRNVIYKGSQVPQDIFLRILLFKIFNKIETWELLNEKFGEITAMNFNPEVTSAFLSAVMSEGVSIFSGAYIMPNRSSPFLSPTKHVNYLELLAMMLNNNVPQKICESKNLKEVFTILKSQPLLGDFLAYQYSIDINYSNLTNHSESEFVIAGPGAKSGITKCFSNHQLRSFEEIIVIMQKHQGYFFGQQNLHFRNLWGRELQLIDCQNLFCEIDKYSRYAFPHAKGLGNRSRIKQIFKQSTEKIEYFFPPKWQIRIENVD